MSEKKKIEWWPIGLVGAMLVFVGGILFAVSIMVRNDVPLTSDDYYAKEIAYQDQIDKSSRGLSPAQMPVIRELRATEAVEIHFPNSLTAASFSGKATMFRPSDPKKDFALDLKVDDKGMQWVSLKGRDAGLWQLQLEWTEDGIPYYFEQQVMH